MFAVAMISAHARGAMERCHATPISADWGEFDPRTHRSQTNRLSYVYGVMLNRKDAGSSTGRRRRAVTYAKFGRRDLASPAQKPGRFSTPG